MFLVGGELLEEVWRMLDRFILSLFIIFRYLGKIGKNLLLYLNINFSESELSLNVNIVFLNFGIWILVFWILLICFSNFEVLNIFLLYLIFIIFLVGKIFYFFFNM